MKLRIALICACLTFTTALAHAKPPQIDPEKAADLRRLIELTGSLKLAQEEMTRMAEQMKPVLLRNLPPGERSQEIADTFVHRLLARATPDEYIKMIMPVYDKYLTLEDVKGLLQFYESPVGKHFVQVMPKMTAEYNEVGARWGQEIAREVLQQMSKEYPELKQVQ